MINILSLKCRKKMETRTTLSCKKIKWVYKRKLLQPVLCLHYHNHEYHEKCTWTQRSKQTFTYLKPKSYLKMLTITAAAILWKFHCKHTAIIVVQIPLEVYKKKLSKPILSSDWLIVALSYHIFIMPKS